MFIDRDISTYLNHNSACVWWQPRFGGKQLRYSKLEKFQRVTLVPFRHAYEPIEVWVAPWGNAISACLHSCYVFQGMCAM